MHLLDPSSREEGLHYHGILLPRYDLIIVRQGYHDCFMPCKMQHTFKGMRTAHTEISSGGNMCILYTKRYPVWQLGIAVGRGDH